MSSSSQIFTGDTVYLNFSNYVLCKNNGNTTDLPFAQLGIEGQNYAAFYITKLTWDYTTNGNECKSSGNDTKCGTMYAVDAGQPIFYGDFILLFFESGQLLTSVYYDYDEVALTSETFPAIINNCNYITQTAGNSNSFNFCGDTSYSSSIWCPVNVDGLGYYSDDHIQHISSVPLTYGSVILLQNVAAQTCVFNNKNKYLYCNTKSDLSYPFLGKADIMSIANDYPNNRDSPGSNLCFARYCSWDNNCGQVSCPSPVLDRSIIKSGQYICLFSSQSALPVAISGSSDHTLGFNDTGNVGPGDPSMTFVIKKINIDKGTFYRSTDDEAGINIGEPFVLFGKTASGVQGLVYTAGDYSFPGGYNNVLIKDNLQVYHSTTDCGNGGSAYATWCFVAVDGTGNVSGGNLKQNTGIPVKFGDTFMIQNYGKSICNAFSSADLLKTVADYIESNNFWHQDGNTIQYNTPNLNVSSMSAAYPTGNNEYFFYSMTYTGGFYYSSTDKVEDCENCQDNCDVSKGCCGCDDARKRRQIIKEILLLAIILIVIIVVIMLIFGILVMLKI